MFTDKTTTEKSISFSLIQQTKYLTVNSLYHSVSNVYICPTTVKYIKRLDQIIKHLIAGILYILLVNLFFSNVLLTL